MKKKRSVGITLLAIYLLVSGLPGLLIGGVVPATPWVKGSTLIFALAAIVCGLGLLGLRAWAYKTTVGFLVMSILWAIAYNSPLFLQDRLRANEEFCQRVRASVKSETGYILNEKRVTREEFLRYQEMKQDRMRQSGCQWPIMLMSIIIGGGLLYYMCRSTVIEQFKSTE